MGIIRSVYYLLSPYVDARERHVAKFFDRLSEHNSRVYIGAELDILVQENIAVVNLWTEFRYKGYRYLTKSKRRELYANLDRITEDFEKFYRTYGASADEITRHVRTIVPGVNIRSDQVRLIQAIMDYLSPSNGRYEYRASSSFGRLLRDPLQDTMVGDCNQIVTLYIYLYSRYLDVKDLRVRTLPGHVALHCGGVDIEATNGTWKNYASSADASVLPLSEIVSINLLDTTDEYFETHEVRAEDFLQSARFAYLLSHERDIVSRNLDAAYGKVVSQLMKRNSYEHALKVARASRDAELLAVVGNNGAIYYMGKNDFIASRRFAEYALRKPELIRDSWRAEGVYHYNANRFHDAIRAFKHCNDEKLVSRCYEGLFFVEQDKLPKNLTSESIRNHKHTIRRMDDYARKSKNHELIQHLSTLKKYL